MKTRSVAASQVCSLGTSVLGGGGTSPFSVSLSRRGPAVPTCSQTAAAPGPPLKTNVIGRVAGSSATGSFSYATKNRSALCLPASSFIASVPAVARYLSGLPNAVISCSVVESLSTPGFVSEGLVSGDFLSEGASCANVKGAASVMSSSETRMSRANMRGIIPERRERALPICSKSPRMAIRGLSSCSTQPTTHSRPFLLDQLTVVRVLEFPNRRAELLVLLHRFGDLAFPLVARLAHRRQVNRLADDAREPPGDGFDAEGVGAFEVGGDLRDEAEHLDAVTFRFRQQQRGEAA